MSSIWIMFYRSFFKKKNHEISNEYIDYSKDGSEAKKQIKKFLLFVLLFCAIFFCMICLAGI